jgi:hypothetical protein
MRYEVRVSIETDHPASTERTVFTYQIEARNEAEAHEKA